MSGISLRLCVNCQPNENAFHAKAQRKSEGAKKDLALLAIVLEVVYAIVRFRHLRKESD